MVGHFLLVAVLGLPLAAGPRMGSYPVTLAMLFLAMFVTGGFTIGGLAYATRHYSTAHSGFIGGFASGSWAAGVPLMMPVVGRLLGRHRCKGAVGRATALPPQGDRLGGVRSRAKD